MKRLSIFDLEEIRIGAGRGEGPVTLPREVFDALVEGYDVIGRLPYGASFNMRREIKRLTNEE